MLERLGFVRLRDYGLILTQDRRVVTTRPVLDDGFGATVVGWEGNDLAVMELARRDSDEAPPASVPELPLPVFTPIAVVPPPPKPAVVLDAAPPPPALALVPEPEPDDEPETEDDEWEWEIAMARARAERADDVVRSIEKSVKPIAPALTSAPANTEDTAIRSVTRLARISEQERQRELAVADGARRTIIPVPQLPVAKNVGEITRQLPLPSGPRRFPKASMRIAPQRGDDSTAVDVVRARVAR